MKKICIQISVIMLSAAFLLTGCGGSNSQEFTVAYLPVEDSTSIQEIRSDFEKDLGQVIGKTVKSYQSTSYSAAIEAVTSGKVDMAMLSPFSYVVASNKGGVELLADLNISGTMTHASGYYSCFFTGKDSNITSLKNIKGTTIAFGDPASTTGHLLPKYKLVTELGVDVNTLENGYFKDIVFSGGHDKTVIGVAQGTYDVGAGYCQMADILAEKGVIEKDDVKIIGGIGKESGINISASPMVVRADLDATTMKQVKDFIMTYDNPEYFEMLGAKGGSFIEPNQANYEGLKKVAETLGLSEEELLR